MTASLPLQMAPTGTDLHVIGIKAGHGLTRRLAELGFNEQATVRVIKAQGNGPLIVQLNNSRFALGKGMAMKIMVEPTSPA
jgi:ferrous iron transport protein A